VNSDEATVAVIDALDALRISYMVVGSFSSNFYGIPRATQDADFVVQLEAGRSRRSRITLEHRFGWIRRCHLRQ